MDEFQVFGDPARLELAVRWRGDAERRARRPADYGWSMGDIRIVVAGQNLSANLKGASRQSYASWYLLPLFDWLADHWEDLLHGGEFPWPERSAAPAAVAAQERLDGLIDADDASGRRRYAEAQIWRNAHALRTAAYGGLLPDLFVRRYLDTVELSWTAAKPLFTPDQFRFAADPGVAYLPVRDVATPIWDMLGWAARTGDGRIGNDRDAAALTRLRARLRSIEGRTVVDFAAARIGRGVAEAAHAALLARGVDAFFTAERVTGVPAVERFSAAVAMFGGLDPALSPGDVGHLADVVAAAAGGTGETPRLAALVDGTIGPPMRSPHIEGQELALTLLDEPSVMSHVSSFVDVEGLLDEVGVAVSAASLDTRAIRGVALAGTGLTPTILVNRSSFYNDTVEGVRFTLAHEFAHLLYDRSRAISVGMASGPWAHPGVEKRANAFAAMVLMPRHLVLQAFGAGAAFHEPDAIAAAAALLRVSASTLVEHLANLELVTPYEREVLRRHVRRTPVGHVPDMDQI